MACVDLRTARVSGLCALLAGCHANPFFHIASDGGTGGGEEAETTATASEAATSEAATSGGAETTAGASAEASTQAVDVSGPDTDDLTGADTTAPPGTTTGDPDTGSTSTGSTGDESGSSGEPAVCGNGVLETGEECDQGVANDEAGECLPTCMAATCGDGLVLDGVEACDLGLANNNTAGPCTTLCEEPRCGDGFKQVDKGEGCDDGSMNGAGINHCSPDCVKKITQELYIKVLTAKVNGTLSLDANKGIMAADAACASEFGLKYRAMVSDGLLRVASKQPYEGLVINQTFWVLHPYRSYINHNGAVISVTTDRALLGTPEEGSSALVNAIGGDPEARAWTGLKDDWTASNVDCNNWMTAEQGFGSVGKVDDATDKYLRLEGQDVDCEEERKLYCVEQPL